MFRSTVVLFLLFCLAFAASAAIEHDKPPFGLSVEQALNWHPESQWADKRNVSRIALAKRFEARHSQLNPRLNPDVKVLIAPDGMNNLANYIDEQPQFNLYNFTHWSQIDVLNWFAGTADLTVNIPSRPWVEAAHKNGVKVIGTIYLAVAQWGGSADTAEAFLVRDDQGRFPMAHKLVAMAEYYGFDGWLMNQETDLSAVKDDQNNLVKGVKDYNRAAKLGREMLAFMTYFNHIATENQEIHWYDAQLVNGEVAWQNQLNEKNAPFFGSRFAPVSDGLFLNYWWNRPMVKASHDYAKKLGRSPYDVYTGADLWPTRAAQRIFTETAWLDDIFSDELRQGLTSIALFGNNVNFPGSKPVAAHSRFQDDANDFQLFYDSETRLFAGDDFNMATHQHEAWKGISRYVPANSVLSSLPFESHFNTGHGRFKAKAGNIVKQESWHDVSQQDVLPSWQFAFLGNASASARFDFSTAWQGGSSLNISGDATKGDIEMPLYKTRLVVQAESVYLRTKGDIKHAQMRLDLADGEQIFVPLGESNESWQSASLSLSPWRGKTIERLSLIVNEHNANNFTLLLGAIKIE